MCVLHRHHVNYIIFVYINYYENRVKPLNYITYVEIIWVCSELVYKERITQILIMFDESSIIVWY